MTKPLKGITVGWDLDGVLFDFTGEFRKLAIRHGYIDDDAPAETQWSFYKDWGLSLEDFMNIFHTFVEQQKYCAAKATPGASYIINTLRSLGATNVAITSRRLDGYTDMAIDDTERWVYDNNLGFDTLLVHEDKTIIYTHFFIDDKIENVEALRAAGTNAVLLDQPWNVNATHLPRVYSILEYMDLILSEVKRNGQNRSS